MQLRILRPVMMYQPGDIMNQENAKRAESWIRDGVAEAASESVRRLEPDHNRRVMEIDRRSRAGEPEDKVTKELLEPKSAAKSA